MYPMILLGIFWLIIGLLYEPLCSGGKGGCLTDHLMGLASFPTLILAIKFDLLHSSAANMGKLYFADSLVASINILLIGVVLGKFIDYLKK